MPHQIMNEEQLDFVIAEASKTLRDTEFIRLTTHAIGNNKIKMKFKTKSRLYTYIVDTKEVARLEGKYPKVRKV